jgi:hypothetical protein
LGCAQPSNRRGGAAPIASSTARFAGSVLKYIIFIKKRIFKLATLSVSAETVRAREPSGIRRSAREYSNRIYGKRSTWLNVSQVELVTRQVVRVPSRFGISGLQRPGGW